MAPPDRKPRKTEDKPWRQAALGGVLVALGGALFGFGRKSDPQKNRPAFAAIVQGASRAAPARQSRG